MYIQLAKVIIKISNKAIMVKLINEKSMKIYFHIVFMDEKIHESFVHKFMGISW